MFRNRTLSSLLITVILALPVNPAGAALWQKLEAESRGFENRSQVYLLDEAILRERLRSVPHQALADFSHEIELPMPDGSLARYQIVESPILDDRLAADFPSFRSYKLYGIDDPTAVGRADISVRGFHALLHTSQGRLFIDPDHGGTAQHYLARTTRGLRRSFSCGAYEIDQGFRPPPGALKSGVSARVPGMLLQYEIAVAATDDYVTAVAGAGDTAGAQLQINTTINRVNLTYERDHGIVFVIVAGNQNLIEDGGNVAAEIGADFENPSVLTMLDQNQLWLDAKVTDATIAGYDIGHVFSTANGGVARLGSVCTAGVKARGVSGLPSPIPSPIGDFFAVDLVAHEIGHQFAANHTFNGTTLSCGFSNRNAATAFEPGSGSTIMAYAGICGAENLVNNFPLSSSDDTFHAGSIDEVDTFTGGAGGACATQIATSPVNNADPTLTAISDYTIPPGTPFQLVASATDTESGTALIYQWDQMDAGTETTAATLGQDLGDNALFRTYEPSLAFARRDFPALGTQVRGEFDAAETLPCRARTIDMRVTVRDEDSGQDTEDVRLTVAPRTAGVFAVTSQTADQTLLGDFTVTWNVADTSLTPVSCPNVAIELMVFDDVNYSNHTIHTLVATTPNNGSAVILQPADSIINPARGRIRVRCLNNVFYALSRGNLLINGTNTAPQTFFDNDDNATFYPDTDLIGTVDLSCGATGVGDDSVGGGSGDSGSVSPWWLVLVLGSLAALRWRRAQG